MDGWIDRDDDFFVASVIHKFHADVSDCVNNILPHHRLPFSRNYTTLQLEVRHIREGTERTPPIREKQQEELLRSETPVRRKKRKLSFHPQKKTKQKKH